MDDIKTKAGRSIIIKPVWGSCVDISIDGIGYIGRIFKSDLEWAIKRLQDNEYASIYRY